MAITSITKLKEWFSAGKRPTGEQFASLIDSFFHKSNKLSMDDIEDLIDKLNNKLSSSGDGSKLNVKFKIEGDDYLSGDDALYALFAAINREFYTFGQRIDILERGVRSIRINRFGAGATPQEIGEYAYNSTSGLLIYSNPDDQSSQQIELRYDMLYINDDAESDFIQGIYILSPENKLSLLQGVDIG